MISPEFSLDGLNNLAKREGMVTMFEDGLRKAMVGVTTIEEILRVIRETKSQYPEMTLQPGALAV